MVSCIAAVLTQKAINAPKPSATEIVIWMFVSRGCSVPHGSSKLFLQVGESSFIVGERPRHALRLAIVKKFVRVLLLRWQPVTPRCSQPFNSCPPRNLSQGSAFSHQPTSSKIRPHAVNQVRMASASAVILKPSLHLEVRLKNVSGAFVRTDLVLCLRYL